VRVLAPAGYGKSTLIARWLADEHREVLWLDLERIDNDPLVLMSALADGLSELAPPGQRTTEGGRRHDTPIEDVIVPTFGDLVRSCSTPFVMVLDDLHVIDQPAAEAVIDAIARNLPSASTLVLSGRSHRRDDAIAALRLRPGVDDLDASDLAFDITETEEMLTAAGLELDLTALTSLAQEFEGWPAGLRLAALAMWARGDHGEGQVGRLGGADYVVDYLGTEWVAGLDPDDRQLLFELACLERFTSEMCDTVLGRQGSSDALRRLRSEQLLRLVPFDRSDRWYRMHPLLATWLSSQLRDRDRARWCAIQLGASRWWAEAGDIDLAVEHADRAADVDLCASLVTTYGPLYVTRGQNSTVNRWLSKLSNERIRQSPDLCAMATANAIQTPDGDQALQWSRALASSVARNEDDQLRLQSQALTATLEPRPATELVAGCEHAHRHIAPGPWRIQACWTLGGLYFLMGDARAHEVLSEGVFESEVAGSPLPRANILATLAVVLELLGEHDRSTELTQAAHAELHPFRLETLPSTAIVSAMHALVEMRSGRRDAAVAASRMSRAHLAGYTGVAPWFNVMARLPLARACIIAGDFETARVLLDEIGHHLRFEPDGHGATEHVEALREHTDAARDALIDQSSVLTAAELRVLQYLPTNLSLADIATLLYVSRNTVKTHAAAIYRKLGTTSRRHAVEIAREWGLLASGFGRDGGA
jgi:LuxR family transcriptional regulator, maltose regulon positive regulatory protein